MPETRSHFQGELTKIGINVSRTTVARHRKHFPEFSDLQQEVDRALLRFAQTPRDITVLMARYSEQLGQVDKAA